MSDLDEISAEELRRTLQCVEGKKPTQRLMVAIAYKEGVSKADLAEWYGISLKTVYNWLDRIESKPIEEAIHDDDRPGRPPALDEDQRRRLEETLHDSPREVGYDASAWTPILVRHFVQQTFGVEYSLRHTRRVMKELGLRPVRDSEALPDAGEKRRWAAK